MAEVTGFTADRMRVIENETVVDGEVQGDDLVLLTRQGIPINAGNVRGPKGDQGIPGEVSSVNDQIGDIYTPRVFADKVALDAWAAPPGTHAFTTDVRGEWLRVGSSWVWVASPRIFADHAALVAETSMAMDGAHAYTILEDVNWTKVAGTWKFDTAPRIFASASALASSWWATNAPNGAMATTQDLGIVWHKRLNEWVPVSAAFAGVHQTLGGFPAGGYSWPAAGQTNIAGYLGSPFFYKGGLTQYTGLYTCTATLYIQPSDVGDISIQLAGGGQNTSNTTVGAFASCSCTFQNVMPPGQQIYWQMYKHANTGGWTTSSIRFSLAFQTA